MIIPKIPKNQAQPACPVKAINPAIPIATATPDQPLRFTLFAFLFILTNLQISKWLGDLKSPCSKNYIPFRLKMIFHSRGDLVSYSCLAFARSLNIGLTENSSRYRSCFFEAPEFSQIAFGDFVKPNIKWKQITTHTRGKKSPSWLIVCPRRESDLPPFLIFPRNF